MIGWLDGKVGDSWRDGNRSGVLLICAGVGYEVQVSDPKLASIAGSALTLHVHQQQRDDGSVLFGFAAKQERDLFRLLISVNGVGPQVAMGLLGSLGLDGLLEALFADRTAALCSAPGVGKRTAERLTLEWRSRLQERWSQLGGQVALTLIASGGPQQTLRTELESTLSALGYGPEEPQQAMAHCSRELEESAPLEEWLRQCLAWLSREAA